MSSSAAAIAPAHEEPISDATVPHHIILRYFSVVASVALAVLVRFPLHPILGSKAAFVTLFPAIVYSA